MGRGAARSHVNYLDALPDKKVPIRTPFSTAVAKRGKFSLREENWLEKIGKMKKRGHQFNFTSLLVSSNFFLCVCEFTPYSSLWS